MKYYQISSGNGPVECEERVAKFLGFLNKNYKIEIIQLVDGCQAGTLRSAYFKTESDLSDYLGTVKRISQKILDSAKGDAAYIIRAEQAKNGQSILEIAFNFIKNGKGTNQYDFVKEVADWMERRIEKVDPILLEKMKKQKQMEAENVLAELLHEHMEKINAAKDGYREEGRAQGIQQGMQQGIEQQKATLLEMLEIHFGNMPEHWKEEISGISNANSLKELTKAILKTETPDEFSSLLKKMAAVHQLTNS